MTFAKFAALSAAALTVSTAVPAAAQDGYDDTRVLSRVSSQDLRAIVADMGFTVSGSVPRGNGFSLSINTPESKPNFFIMGEKCLEQYAGCASVKLTTGTVPKAGLTLADVNDLNNAYVPKVSLEANANGTQTLRTQTYIVVDEGMTMANLKVNIVVFLRDLAEIKAKAGR